MKKLNKSRLCKLLNIDRVTLWRASSKIKKESKETAKMSKNELIFKSLQKMAKIKKGDNIYKLYKKSNIDNNIISFLQNDFSDDIFKKLLAEIEKIEFKKISSEKDEYTKLLEKRNASLQGQLVKAKAKPAGKAVMLKLESAEKKNAKLAIKIKDYEDEVVKLKTKLKKRAERPSQASLLEECEVVYEQFNFVNKEIFSEFIKLRLRKLKSGKVFGAYQLKMVLEAFKKECDKQGVSFEAELETSMRATLANDWQGLFIQKSRENKVAGSAKTFKQQDKDERNFETLRAHQIMLAKREALAKERAEAKE